jgi:hypothetical protein
MTMILTTIVLSVQSSGKPIDLRSNSLNSSANSTGKSRDGSEIDVHTYTRPATMHVEVKSVPLGGDLHVYSLKTDLEWTQPSGVCAASMSTRQGIVTSGELERLKGGYEFVDFEPKINANMDLKPVFVDEFAREFFRTRGNPFADSNLFKRLNSSVFIGTGNLLACAKHGLGVSDLIFTTRDGHMFEADGAPVMSAISISPNVITDADFNVDGVWRCLRDRYDFEMTGVAGIQYRNGTTSIIGRWIPDEETWEGAKGAVLAASSIAPFGSKEFLQHLFVERDILRLAEAGYALSGRNDTGVVAVDEVLPGPRA